MITALNVAEKPSVAKEVSAILSRNSARRRDGHSPYNAVFEFSVSAMGQDVNMIFTSVTGHLMEMDFDPTLRGWSSCHPRDLFTAPVVKSVKSDDTSKKIERTLKQEARKAQWLILWLDCDREGENIAVEVRDICLQANRRLDVYRAKFSALIPRDIFAAINALNRVNERMAKAVDARQELDLRFGSAFTRFQTMRLQTKFAGLGQLISYGPCQFPTLGFVVQRYNRIQSFVPEDFWYIRVLDKRRDRGTDEELEAEFSWRRNRLFNRLACLVLYEAVLAHSEAVVIDIESRETKRRKPLPLATVEFQKRATRWLRLSADRAMAVAENLYNRGLLSYPRTETEVFKEGTDLAGLISAFDHHSMGLINGGKFEIPARGPNDDNAHPPIHPTKAVELNTLEGDERKVYELVVRHFLACCSRNAVGHQTKITIDIAGEEFSTSGLIVLERNYLEVYTYEKWTGKTIPQYQQGERFQPSSILMMDGRTQAPPLLSEPDLIGLMDRHGIGTDATMAEHIKKIQVRAYVKRVNGGQQFEPTPLGLALVNAYEEMGFPLAQPEKRAKMERDCKSVVDGLKQPEEVLRSCVTEMREVFEGVAAQAQLLEDSVLRHYEGAGQQEVVEGNLLRNNLGTCGRCRGPLDLMSSVPHEGGGNTRRFLRCSTCNIALSVPRNGRLSRLDNLQCPLCTFSVLSVSEGDGYQGSGYSFCTWCYSHPPEGMTGQQDMGGGFRCFQCTANCPQASGRTETPLGRCIACGRAEMVLKKTRTDKWLISCKGYPECRTSNWLPEGTRTVECLQSTCDRCECSGRGAVKKISLTFTPGSVPPYIPQSFEACFQCNDDLKELMAAAPRGGGGGGRQTQQAGGTAQGGRGNAQAGRGNSRLATGNPPPPLRANGAPGRLPSSGVRGGPAESSNGSSKCPTCRADLAPLTVRKPGPTQGKIYYKCEPCGYFAFDDGGGQQSVRSAAANRGRAGIRGRGVGGRGGGRGITCYSCGEEGHMAPDCTNKEEGGDNGWNRDGRGAGRGNKTGAGVGNKRGLGGVSGGRGGRSGEKRARKGAQRGTSSASSARSFR